jgi:hypothetical protein
MKYAYFQNKFLAIFHTLLAFTLMYLKSNYDDNVWFGTEFNSFVDTTWEWTLPFLYALTS